MRSSTLLASALAASAFALPQGQLEKRQIVNTVTVTVTVTIDPRATAVWAGPPKVSNPPRPSNAPPSFSVNIPSPDAGRSSTPRSSSVRSTPIPSRTPPAGPGGGTPPVATPPVISPSAGPGGANPPVVSPPSSSAVVGSPVSNNPAPSNAVPPPSGSAPLDPGPHTPGTGQAYLNVASGAAYRNSILYHHNAARANHGAAPLVWNDTVAATAKITADTCRFEHSVPRSSGQGQNLFTTSGPVFNVTAGITESWYKDEFPPMVRYFGVASIPAAVFPEVGHLTQLLWKGTTSVGCYSLDCTGKMVVNGVSNSPLNKYTVCNYWPAGNVATQYAINVGSPRSSTNLGSWSN